MSKEELREKAKEYWRKNKRPDVSQYDIMADFAEYWKEKAIHYSNKCDTLTNALMAKTTPTDLDLLDRLIEYMESRADADGDSEGIYPNEEMRLQKEIEELKLKKDHTRLFNELRKFRKENQQLKEREIKLEDLCSEAMGEQDKNWRDRFKELLTTKNS